jgi:hypothetical protein
LLLQRCDENPDEDEDYDDVQAEMQYCCKVLHTLLPQLAAYCQNRKFSVMHVLLNADVYSRGCSIAAMYSALTRYTLYLLHLHVFISAGVVHRMLMVLLVVVALLVLLLQEATELCKVQDAMYM